VLREVLSPAGASTSTTRAKLLLAEVNMALSLHTCMSTGACTVASMLSKRTRRAHHGENGHSFQEFLLLVMNLRLSHRLVYKKSP
jgi:hypothetical protein